MAARPRNAIRSSRPLSCSLVSYLSMGLDGWEARPETKLPVVEHASPGVLDHRRGTSAREALRGGGQRRALLVVQRHELGCLRDRPVLGDVEVDELLDLGPAVGLLVHV